MRVAVILNERAGAAGASASSPGAEDVREAFRACGVEAEVNCVSGERLADAARQAADAGLDGVVAAGGDGTVSAVAQVLAGGETPLGVLPLGTLNHFAKDNGLPLDLVDSVKVIARGQWTTVDVARVNDRAFVNNSSVGVYARALIDRDSLREQTGMGKWQAMLLAVWKIFRRSPLVRVRLATDDHAEVLKTPLVFVGNNRYDLDLLRIGTRTCLDDGVLSMYLARTQSRWGMLTLGVRAALGRLEQARDFDARCVTSVEVNVRRPRIHVAIDGEVVRMDTPLAYSIWPRALRVFVPAADAKVGAATGSPPRRPK